MKSEELIKIIIDKMEEEVKNQIEEVLNEISIPFTLEHFKDAVERIRVEYHRGKLDLVGLFEIETLEYYYKKAKENEKEEEK